MEAENVIWHPEVLPPDAHQTLTLLSAQPTLKSFYLAGGTALALRWGHRTSVDLDFFSSDVVNEEGLLSSLQQISGIKVISRSPETLHLHIGATKVSFIGYHYPVLFPMQQYHGVSVADPRDIAAMKLSAIASRGTKRDFVDLYVLSEKYGLDELLRIFQQKFAQTEYNPFHILKSLTYFADADKEPMPHLLRPIAWEQIKQFFIREAPRLEDTEGPI